MIKILRDDITQIAVDASVTTANSSLWDGKGVDAATQHLAGGPKILEECREFSAGECVERVKPW